ncbi:5-formyltetrahydrofolate cyclo-ligase [Flavobacterium salilacus subsp. salilacus]|uniref:5-formyltetrahydrofolate cyclo-ligase n=1 Tax=Flavobacterium TaxID=237 RepID=UPI0010756CEE|nr:MULTISPECIES: 5-formyltetrahydrofolate cyclo-ligase [Flavobacterium]KAF2518286.1 5-formyltetrahydrofolate cyclo-ligase [Flavobacterium salilacus subsp. salilacus]MBE1615302.1 5-formyltetrahydrofolate cyclo-ligase [Flavobacterium sp. SaA2.13]
MTKQEIRTKYRALRKSLTTKEVEEKSLAIANRLLQLPVWDKTYYHLFLSIEEQKEVQTEFILHLLAGKDKEIVVAQSDFDSHEMTHYLLTDNTRLVKNQYGIPEPVDGLEVPVTKLDVVFIPLLAFDIFGNRLGYGKGFYDRFLAQCRPDTLKIGLSFFGAEEKILPNLPTDMAMDYCVTPYNTYTFTTK